MMNVTTARATLRTVLAAALLVVVTGLGAQVSWAAGAGDTIGSTVTTATTEDATGPGNANNPWD
ncbi:hypothetical protein N566_08125 [Streptomycetaceae bacterium MP113-05]|nr:hypothetical protein N566_08125 [Streptomycetaceae bacterium MP113-05]